MGFAIRRVGYLEYKELGPGVSSNRISYTFSIAHGRVFRAQNQDFPQEVGQRHRLYGQPQEPSDQEINSPDDFVRRGDKSAPLSEIRKLNRASPPSFSAESISNFLHIPSSFALTPARYWFTALAETEGLKEVTLVTLI